MDTTLTPVTGFDGSATPGGVNTYVVVALGVLVVVAFVVGFLIGYFVRGKKSRKQKPEDDDQSSIETAYSTKHEKCANQGRNKESMHHFDVSLRPPALPPCPHPTIPKANQSGDALQQKNGSENEVNKGSSEERGEITVKSNSGTENDISAEPTPGTGTDVLSRHSENKRCKSEFINYIDSKEINPRIIRIEESNSIIDCKSKSRQPTYLSLVTENTAISLELDDC